MDADRKPTSPYGYYRKLVSDFDALESELEANSEEQKQLQARFYGAKSSQRESERRKREREAKKWSTDRDQQIENIVKHQTHFNELSQQADQLVDQEIRLQAELEVLHEKQQAEKTTAAVQLRDLIHKKSRLLEDELTKGQMDLEFIAELIDASRNNRTSDQGEEDKIAVRAVVQRVQNSRLQTLESAKQKLEEQLTAFGRDQEALNSKVNEIRTRKQRALQILSSNQQEAIKDFFTTLVDIRLGVGDSNRVVFPEPSEAIAKYSTSLDFDAILARVDPRVKPDNLKGVDLETKEARWQVEDAGVEAKALIERGVERLLYLEQALLQRKKEADDLDSELETEALEKSQKQTLLKSAWTIDSCPPELFEEASLMQRIVIECAEKAVGISESRHPNFIGIAHHIFVDTLLADIAKELVLGVMNELQPRNKPKTNGVSSAFRNIFHRGNHSKADKSTRPSAKATKGRK